MAEAVRFELTIRLLLCRFSRPVPSAARPRFLYLAPQRGIEPRTNRLTVYCSTAELSGNFLLITLRTNGCGF